MTDPLALALALLRFDTVSPPGTEAACAAHLAALLEAAGFTVSRSEFAPGRTSLVARRAGTDGGLAPLAFTGHLDTVPLGARAWSADPFGEIRDGRLYGRGASDMKAGVAAFLTAAIEGARGGALRRGLLLVLTAGEETGCKGARDLAVSGMLGAASGLVIAEPTANRLALAHKGALHLRARTAGATAHGSMPELGDNAVSKAAAAIGRLDRFRFDLAPDPLLGRPTATVTSVHGGEAVNVVPDSCTFTVDVRTLPGQTHDAVRGALADCAGPHVAWDEPLVDLPAVGTAAEVPFAICAAQSLAVIAGTAPGAPLGMPYFTDGSVLQAALGGCPTAILGPGEPGQAHQTDEWCEAAAIGTAAAVYREVIARWCG